MDKLIAIKIKYDDGTYSDEIPISVLSENVEWDSAHTLVDVLGSINVDVTGTIQDQISQLFNEKVSATQLQNYVASQLNEDVSTWLNNNVNPVGSAVVVDSSLTIPGAAADAKVVGNLSDLIGDLNSMTKDSTGNSVISGWVDGKFISTNGSTYNPNNAIGNDSYRYVFIDCNPGDVFTINGTGGGNPRLWAFVHDSDNIHEVLDPKAGVDETATNLVITAPLNATRLILNDKKTGKCSYYGKILVNIVDEISQKVESNNQVFEKTIGNTLITNWIENKRLSTNGSVFNPQGFVNDSTFRCAIVSCNPGDVFTINGTGGGNPRLWAFADVQNNILDRSAVDATGSDLIITAPANAIQLIINDKKTGGICTYGEIVTKAIEDLNVLMSSMVNVDFIEYSGYIGTNGSITSATENQEVYTNRIFVKPGQKIDFSIKFPQIRDMWLGYGCYDKYGKFLSRVGIISGNYIQYSTRVTADADTSYISFTYRTFNESTVSIRTNPVSSLDGEISNAESNITLFDYTINQNVKGINHRGFNTIAPENTFPAFKLSKKMGFGYVETDVQFNASGTPVLMHDTTINRTCCVALTGESLVGQNPIYIGSLTDSDMEDYDACKSEKWDTYKGTKIPTFAEFIGLCRSIGLHPYIETKSDVTYSREQIESLVDIVKSYGMIDNVTWISFSSTQIGYVKNYCPSARVGFVVSNISNSTIQTVQSLGDNAFISVSSSNLTDETVDLCIDAGIPLEVWTVNDPSVIESLNNYVTGITSDKLIAGYELYKSNIEG